MNSFITLHAIFHNKDNILVKTKSSWEGLNNAIKSPAVDKYMHFLANPILGRTRFEPNRLRIPVYDPLDQVVLPPKLLWGKSQIIDNNSTNFFPFETISQIKIPNYARGEIVPGFQMVVLDVGDEFASITKSKIPHASFKIICCLYQSKHRLDTKFRIILDFTDDFRVVRKS